MEKLIKDFKVLDHRVWWSKYTKIPYGECWCGCNSKTKISKRTLYKQLIRKNKPTRYINGHYRHANGEKGQLKCSKCLKIKLISNFYKAKSLTKYREKYGYISNCKECIAFINMERKYGITKEIYNKLYKSQNKKCAICCKNIKFLSKNTHIDHCHKTGQIRGLLCGRCNLGLGCFSDNIYFLEKAKYYLTTNDKWS